MWRIFQACISGQKKVFGQKRIFLLIFGYLFSPVFLSAVQQRPSWIHWSRKAFWVVQSKQRGVCSRKVGSPPWYTEMMSEPIRTVETHHAELRILLRTSQRHWNFVILPMTSTSAKTSLRNRPLSLVHSALPMPRTWYSQGHIPFVCS